MEQEVLSFIDGMTQGRPEVIEIFSQGYCYYFAVMLRERFYSSVILYDQIEGHFLTMIGNQLYDVTGNVTERFKDSKGLLPWEVYEGFDPLLYQRICKNVIMK